MERESNNKYTPEGLPVMTKSTLEMYFIEEERLDKENEDSFLKTLEKRADEVFSKNPLLEPALSRFCKTYSLDEMETEFIKGAGVFVYELLKRQAQINNLEK